MSPKIRHCYNTMNQEFRRMKAKYPQKSNAQIFDRLEDIRVEMSEPTIECLV